VSWTMSNDYAAIVTTLDGAILVIGTAQFVGIYKKFTEKSSVIEREKFAHRGRLVEALQRGEEPDAADLVAARRGLILSWDTLLLSLAFAVWGVLAGAVAIVQVQVLRWAATAGENPDPDPELARMAYLVTGAAILALLFEAMAGALIGNLRYLLLNAARDYRDRYSSEARRELEEKVKEAVRQAPRRSWWSRARDQIIRLT
jgi:hypothetical protein